MKVARLRDRIREECAMYIITLSVVTLDEQRDDQILGQTENKKHLLVQHGLRKLSSTELPPPVLNYLRLC